MSLLDNIRKYNPVNEQEVLLVNEDENQAVRWWTFEEALKVSTEPWMVERVYKKLIQKSRQKGMFQSFRVILTVR